MYTTGYCNSDPPIDSKNTEVRAVELAAFEAEMVAVAMFDLPNC